MGMAKKPARKKKQSGDRLIDAAMTLAAERGWRRLTMAEIADEAGLELEQAVAVFASKMAIFNGLISRVDTAVSTAVAEDDNGDESARDRLFDVLMRRFDALAPYKEGLAAILWGLPKEPLAGLCHARRLRRSMIASLTAAGIPSRGCTGEIKAKALAVIYANAVRVWLDDDSSDMAKTMAALDNGLAQAEKLAALIWPGSAAEAPPVAA